MKHTTRRKTMSSNPTGGPISRAGLQRGFALGLLCLLTLSACATSPAARDEAVQQRAQARWDALLAGDYATAYTYLSPGYRSSMSVTDFEISFRTRRIQYLSADYLQHSCEEAVCTVQMTLGYKIARPMTGVPEWKSSSVVEERWINAGGEWWFLPET